MSACYDEKQMREEWEQKLIWDKEDFPGLPQEGDTVGISYYFYDEKGRLDSVKSYGKLDDAYGNDKELIAEDEIFYRYDQADAQVFMQWYMYVPIAHWEKEKYSSRCVNKYLTYDYLDEKEMEQMFDDLKLPSDKYFETCAREGKMVSVMRKNDKTGILKQNIIVLSEPAARTDRMQQCINWMAVTLFRTCGNMKRVRDCGLK